MTEKQFNEAVRINSRINELMEVKDAISRVNSTDKVKLSYVYRYKYNGENHEAILENMSAISSILDLHNKQIRQEIDDEIEKLKKEIEAL